MFIKNTKKENIRRSGACPAKLQRSRGFTLIELLVSIAIFSIALVMIVGATISIVDANKKARTLMTVMNNLNFAVDSMTRSFSTGSTPHQSGNCFDTEEIDYANTTDSLNFETRKVTYCLADEKLYKKIENDPAVLLTSPDIEIDIITFTLDASPQPKLRINLEGTAQVGANVSSTFSIQTTVTQKNLNI